MMRATAVLGWLMIAASSAVAAEVDYLRDVKPVLKARCFACHGSLKQEAGLRLDAGALILQGGDSGAALVPGQPAESLLVERVSDPDPDSRMPPEGEPLTPEQVAALRAWIEQGAVVPADDRPEADPREHWSFRTPVRPTVPSVRNRDWLRNPVDAFIAADHEQRGLAPLGEAGKAHLLRRVTFDLTGLPPSRQQLRDFLGDDSPEAYERVVDRLLSSAEHGERWGRHWMDVWRYSDWYGRRTVPDVLHSYGQIWRWRDWIVRSLNDDRGYDWMVERMLAADEIAPEENEQHVATGFLVRNFFRWNYNSWMKDNVEHTGKAFLGLTFNCCHCHDHKYDPIAQEEYFRFRAFFEPLEIRHDRSPGEPDPGPYPKYDYGAAYKPITSGAVRIYDVKLDAETFLYTGGEARNIIPDRPPVSPGAPAFLGGDRLEIAPVELPARAWYPGLRPFVREEETAKRVAAVQTARDELSQAKQQSEQSLPGLASALKQADAQLALAREQHGGMPGALSGTQSLLLDAASGRRTLAFRPSNLTPLDDGAVVSWKVKILKDAHTNLQLGIDLAAGSTGTYVAFEGGAIQSYRPGTFATFEGGRYDLAAGQNAFEVRLVLEVSADRALLTVLNLADGTKLADAVPVALNGWQPSAGEKHGFFIDARPGSVAVYDDIAVACADGSPELQLDFEPPAYADGLDVTAVAGWTEPPHSAAPATSRVSRLVDRTPEVVEAEVLRRRAERAYEAARLGVPAAESKLAAAEADLGSLQARIAADDAQFVTRLANAEELCRVASRSEREARLAAARFDVLTAEKELAAAEALPPADEKGKAALQQAGQKLTAARTALTAAETALSADSTEYTPLSQTFPQKSTGRRAALARWLVSRENPLTARVAVNHIWQRHFGRGIVSTPDNFGRSGAAPSHPELLDWLAVELMENGWSMKHVHRLIVTSAAYRMTSALHGTDHPNRGTDPENVFLWRFPPQRLEAEAVRDALLAAAGSLDRTMGGHEIEQEHGLTTFRRSLYFSHHGEQRMQFLDLFDAATPSECYERASTIRPQQALAMANGRLSVEQGRLLARRLWDDVQREEDLRIEGSDNGRGSTTAGLTVEVSTPSSPEAGASPEQAFITAVFEQLLTRRPSADEAEAARKFLEEQAAFFSSLPAGDLAATVKDTVPPAEDPQARARENLVQALFSHNDFVSVR